MLNHQKSSLSHPNLNLSKHMQSKIMVRKKVIQTMIHKTDTLSMKMSMPVIAIVAGALESAVEFIG